MYAKVLCCDKNSVVSVQVFVLLRVIIDLLRRYELLIESKASKDISFLSSTTLNVHTKSNLLFEIRYYENYVVDESLKFRFGLFDLLRNETHGVPFIDANIVELHLLVDLARDIDPIRLQFSHKFIKELHVGSLIVHNWYWTIFSIRLDE